MSKFYITTAIPYVNAKPHIGHALEFVQTDTIARYHNKILKEETLLLSGADENALKNVQAAEEENISVQELVDKNSRLFEDLAKKLNVNFDVFQKGSNPQHYSSSQKLWELCKKDIYRKKYKGLYCVGCEVFYASFELNQNGECLEHPGKKLEEVEEENYFFNLKKYKPDIKKLISENILEIIPEKRKHEVLALLNKGLEDISISRSNERAKNWGVPVPNDNLQRMYVWFDALNIYRSGVENKKDKKWWPADVHVIGKGITRFHAIYWPAFLLSAGLELPKKIFVHEYITVNGQKMSKTVGNVLDPIPLIEKYGTDAVRYSLLAKISPFSDGDFSEEKLKQAYNSDLANGLGNLVARVAKLCEKENLDLNELKDKRINDILEEIDPMIKGYKFNDVLGYIWSCIKGLDQYINRERPWQLNLSHSNKRLSLIAILTECVTTIKEIAEALRPFLPETAEKIEAQFRGPKITSQKPLFPRI